MRKNLFIDVKIYIHRVFFIIFFISHTRLCSSGFCQTEYIVISLRISWTFWNVFNSIIKQKSVDSLNKCTVLKKMFTPSKYFMSLTICAEYFVIDWNFSYIEDTSCIHGLSSDFQIVLSKMEELAFSWHTGTCLR